MLLIYENKVLLIFSEDLIFFNKTIIQKRETFLSTVKHFLMWITCGLFTIYSIYKTNYHLIYYAFFT